MGDDVLDLSGEGMTVKQPDFNEPLADGWSPVKTIGADLACSACEIIVDRLQSQMRTAEHAAKEKAKKDKKEEGTEDKKEDSKDKKEDKKSKSKDKKKKKDDKKSKKEEKVQINKAEVAGVVVESVCNHTNFIGMSKIGSYPGRKYTWANYDSTTAATFQIRKDVTNICRSIFNNDDAKAYVIKALSSGGKSKVKRMKRNLCERRAKVCKSAALGYEAESACVMKSMRAFDKGDYEKAKQYAADCGAQTV